MYQSYIIRVFLLFYIVLQELSEGITVKKFVNCTYPGDQYDKVCIVAQFSARFFIDYENLQGKPETSTLEIPEDAQVVDMSQSDPNSLQDLSLQFSNQNHTFSMVFHKNQTHYCITNMSISYFVDENTFPGHINMSSRIENTLNQGPNFCATIDHGYSCRDMVGFRFDDCNTLIRIGEVRLEAFRHSSQTNFEWQSDNCNIKPYRPNGIEIGALILTAVISTFLLVYICRNWSPDF